MDQGVIEAMKRLYRRDQLLGEVEETNIKNTFYKIMTLKDEGDTEGNNNLDESEVSIKNIESNQRFRRNRQ